MRASLLRSPTHRRADLARSLTAALLLSAASQAFGQAPTIDLSIARVEVNQAIQDGSGIFVGGRSTFVRTTVKYSGTPTGTVLVDGIMRVFTNGQEIAGSPFFSKNGPIVVKTSVNPGLENDTLNFTFLPPTASNVVVSVELNPPGPNFYPETDVTNNVKSSPAYSFACRKVPEFAYVPLDYRPNGGSVPNLPNPTLIEPGMGDTFFQGIYPTRDLDYHRTDAPSKLWTSSLDGSGSGLLSALDVDLQLMVPKPDFLYAFVPGGLPYNGQSIINGHVAMGNTEPTRYQRTLAHELGHDFGLQHNTVTVGYFGVDVEDELLVPNNLLTIKDSTLKDIMYAGLLTPEAWVAPSTYSWFYGHSYLACSGLKSAQSDPTFMVTGFCDRDAGTVEVSQALTVTTGELSPSIDPSVADVRVRSFVNDRLVTEVFVGAATSLDGCAACGGGSDSTKFDPHAAFSAVIPALDPNGSPIDRVEIARIENGRAGMTTSLSRSATAPMVAFAAIAPGSTSGMVHLTWTASDADGDSLRYYVVYSPTKGRAIPVATNLAATQFDVDLGKLPAPKSDARFLLLASDGLRTTAVESDTALAALLPQAATGNAPWVYILTPDAGTQHWKGANEILHGSGFDIEDRKLDGDSLEWTSNIDGVIGHGRLTSTASLSVGTHVITLTGRDSSNQTSSDTVTITVTDRGLPAVTTCQASLGFGGPGPSVLSICGGNLSLGTNATLKLTGAAPSQLAFILAATTSHPTPFAGGTLLPIPTAVLISLPTDSTGSLSIPGVPGGGGPLSIYTQIVYVDPTQAHGYGISNAIQIALLP